MVKRCRPSFLRPYKRLFLRHFELSHASTTIWGLVHLFMFYVFPSNEAQETDECSCFWPLSQGVGEEGCECLRA